MSGYAAHARLRGGSTRFAPARRVPRVPADDCLSASPAWLDQERREPARPALGQRVAARWDDLRVAWSQTTFYLFDPDSWR